MLKDIIEERQTVAYQYMRNGYAGGKEGLRCTTCYNKFAGDSALVQLCPRCFTTETAQIVAREVLRKVREGVEEEIPSMPDLCIDSHEGWLRSKNTLLDHLQSLEESLLKFVV
jgi:protein-arginine kinase activator protein McsA